MPRRGARELLELMAWGSVGDRVPDDRGLARVGRVLELSWLREEAAELRAAGTRRAGIDPEAARAARAGGRPAGHRA